jgi:hypothetical protein
MISLVSTETATERATSAPLPKLAYTMAEAAEVSTLSISMLKILVARGQLRSTLIGARRLIPVDALQELIARGV